MTPSNIANEKNVDFFPKSITFLSYQASYIDCLTAIFKHFFFLEQI